MPKENMTMYALLGILDLAPGSGYDVKKFCDSSISHFWKENYGNIYPMLRRLEAEELVESEKRQAQGRPSRNVYSITGKGREKLGEWLRSPGADHPIRSELLLKLFFSEGISTEDTLAMLRAERSKWTDRRASLRGLEERVKTTEPYKSQPGLPLWLLTVDFGVRSLSAAIEWCDEAVSSLEKQRPAE